jgi:hypothetical protein
VPLTTWFVRRSTACEPSVNATQKPFICCNRRDTSDFFLFFKRQTPAGMQGGGGICCCFWHPPLFGIATGWSITRHQDIHADCRRLPAPRCTAFRASRRETDSPCLGGRLSPRRGKSCLITTHSLRPQQNARTVAEPTWSTQSTTANLDSYGRACRSSQNLQPSDDAVFPSRMLHVPVNRQYLRAYHPIALHWPSKNRRKNSTRTEGHAIWFVPNSFPRCPCFDAATPFRAMCSSGAWHVLDAGVLPGIPRLRMGGAAQPCCVPDLQCLVAEWRWWERIPTYSHVL